MIHYRWYKEIDTIILSLVFQRLDEVLRSAVNTLVILSD